MQEKMEILVKCPISKSSNHDRYNDICKATGQQCPYYVDEGMSVCKSKIKCLTYFSKRLSDVNLKQVLKLILSDTRPKEGMMQPSTKKSHSKHEIRTEEQEKVGQSPSEFMADLEDALKSHEEANAKNRQEKTVAEEKVTEEKVIEEKAAAVEEPPKKTKSSSEFLADLEDALKNHEGAVEEEEVSADDHIMAIEESMKKM